MKDEKILEIFGSNLKIYRTIKKMSQDDLIEKTGLSRSYISNIENGKVKLSLVNAVRLANAIGKTLDEMLTEIKL